MATEARLQWQSDACDIATIAHTRVLEGTRQLYEENSQRESNVVAAQADLLERKRACVASVRQSGYTMHEHDAQLRLLQVSVFFFKIN